MNSKVDKPSAVILSGNIGTKKTTSMNEIALALTRSLGRKGVQVYRFHPDRSLVDLNSRYCIHVTCPNLYDDESGLIDALIAFSNSKQVKPVLFPSSDGATQFIARHEGQLRPYFALTSPPWSCVSEIQNKQRLLERARQADVAIPETYFPTCQEETDNIARSLSYPAVVKPLTSQHWKQPEVIAAIGPVKAVTVTGPEELSDLYRKVAPLAPDMMVQEIIPGGDERLLTFLGYISQDGTPLAGCVRKKLRQYPPGFGYCCLTETVIDPEIMELSIRLLKVLNFRGICCVEFKRDPRDGQPKLIEINARAVRTTGVAIAAGVDLPWIAYQDMISPNRPTPVFDYIVPMRWIHLKDEFQAALDLIKAGQLGLREWLRIFHGRIVTAEWAWDDLRPGVMALLPLGRRLFSWPYRHARRRILHRIQPKGEET
jgi:D-aspartate ligase